MIGISEGMILAERYRLVRRHEDLGTGEFWGGVDQETGTEVWVCFSDRPGLGEIAERMRDWKAAATPRILDSGEVRLIHDSRTLGVAGAAGRAATHVEVAIEFAVQEPALGKPLAGRFARKPLAPGEALTLVALLAASLEEALEAGYSHGWLSAASAWNLRRRICLVDLAAGLATPDSEQVEVHEQISGYFAPERVAGGAATEAADVYALGWLLYASLVGLANLEGYYHEAVAAAGSASTAELLAHWRRRSRAHVRELIEEDSALAVLLLAALAEHPADRPTLAAFRAAAHEAATGHAGATALIAYVPKKRPAAAVGAGVGVGAAAVAADVVMEAAAESATSVESVAQSAAGAGTAADTGAESVEVVPTAAASGEAVSGEEVEVEAWGEGVVAAGAAVGAVGVGAHRGRPRLGTGVLVACGIGLLAIGMGSGYAFGASGGGGGSGIAANSKSGIGGGVAAAAVASSAACAPSGSPSATPTASVTASAASSWNENAALPLPTSTAAAVAQLTEIVRGAQSSGLISGGTAGTLRSQITSVQSAIASGSGYASAWKQLSGSIASGRSQGTIPQGLSEQLVTALSYLAEATGS